MNRPRLLAAIILATLLAACGSPAASVDFVGPCVADGRQPGAFPDLEVRLPAVLGGVGPDGGAGGATDAQSPTAVDSGRSCTERALATLWARGVRELRFAGATWDLGDGDGVVSALFTTPSGQPALEAAWMEEFYDSGARNTNKTENIEVTRPTIGGAGEVFRLDTLNSLSLQTVVVWPDPDGVRVVIVATQVTPDASREGHDTVVALAVEQAVTPTQP